MTNTFNNEQDNKVVAAPAPNNGANSVRDSEQNDASSAPVTNQSKTKSASGSSSADRSEIKSFYRKCVEWMAKMDDYQIDAIRNVIKVVMSGGDATDLSAAGYWYINQYLNLGLFKEDCKDTDKVANHRRKRAYTLYRSVQPFLLQGQHNAALEIVMDANANTVELQRSFSWLHSKTEINHN